MPPRASSLAFFVLLALVPGCWLAHETPMGIRGGREDAGPHPGDGGAAVSDAAASDGGIPHPPLRCEPLRADVTCLESFAVEPGRPFELPFAFDQCGCCVETECAVSVDAATQTLSLTTTLCPDPCDCDACVTPTGTCSVPALGEGLWQVIVGGAPAFQLPVIADAGFAPPPPGCATYAEPDRCAPSTPFASIPLDPMSVCVESGPSHSTLDVVRLHESCGTCTTLDAPCYAALEPRLTDDLPPGGEIRLVVGEYGTACDVDCPGVCVPRDYECIVPRLVPGDLYRVWMGDTAVSRFVAGDPSAVCAD